MEEDKNEVQNTPVVESGGETETGAENTAVSPGKDGESRKEKKKEKEFSVRWHLKVLAIIYAVLFIFYLILKITLK